jgi:hypothetical protein
MQSPYSARKSSILENKISLKDNEEGNNSEYDRIVSIHRKSAKITMPTCADFLPFDLISQLHS